MIWRNGLNEEGTHCGMDALEKWMIIRFTPHQTTTLPKWTFLLNFSPNHPCCSMDCAAFKYFPQQQGRPLPSLLYDFSSMCSPLQLTDRAHPAYQPAPLSNLTERLQKWVFIIWYLTFIVPTLFYPTNIASRLFIANVQQTFYHKCPVV